MNDINQRNFAFRLFESIIVIIYIIFEELIWNIFAKPLFLYLKGLVALDAFQTAFLAMNRYVLLFLFVACLAAVEGIGLLSGISFIKGHMLLGIIVYTLKIPTAAFTFWLFDLTKQQLLSFLWFNACYQFVMDLIDQLLNSSVHRYIKSKITHARDVLNDLSIRYFGKNGFIANVKSHYALFKACNKKSASHKN